jgi:hypothetical protein
MLHRLILSIVISLLLLANQQAAALHEISHYSNLVPGQQKQDKVPHSPYCDKCFSYGELANAIAPPYFSVPIFASGFDPVAISSNDYSYPTYLAYSARAPPVLI